MPRCWVLDPPGAPGQHPGLLLQWRQVGGLWQGLVAYAVAEPSVAGVEGDGMARLVVSWLPADRLRADR